MKKLLVVLMAVAVLSCLLAVPAFSTDKLIVKAANGTDTVFGVTSDGVTNITSPIAGNIFNMETTEPVGGAGFNFTVPTGGSWNFKATMYNGFKIRDVTNAIDVMYFAPVSGRVGIGTNNPQYLLDVNGQIRVQTTVYSSSRSLKDNIVDLKSSEAIAALEKLDPVKFNYKNSPDVAHIGFIAEDVPDLVAQKNRVTIDPMDIVAVLTKVVQEQNKTIAALTEKINLLEGKVSKINNKDVIGKLDMK